MAPLAALLPATPALAQEAAPIQVTRGLQVHPRIAWAQDRGPRGPLEPEEVRFLLVHHTASGNGYAAGDVPGVIRQTYDFHTGADKGWPDVAYNFFVDRFGGVWEGRAGSLDGPVAADATGGSQGFAQLVSLIGDFTAVMPTDAAMDALTRTLAWLADRYGVDTSPGATVTLVSRGSNRWPAGAAVSARSISGHRDMSTTACPGNRLYPYVVTELAARVEQLRAGTATPTTAEPPTTSAADATTSAPATSAVPSTLVSTSTVAPPAAASTAAPVAVPAPTDDGGLPVGWVAAGAAAAAVAAGAVARARRTAGPDRRER
jgi:hypothetical protein